MAILMAMNFPFLWPVAFFLVALSLLSVLREWIVDCWNDIQKGRSQEKPDDEGESTSVKDMLKTWWNANKRD
jgi:hypothetical protein